MRVLNYPYNATQCYLKDRYGNARAEFTLKSGGANSLATNSLGSYYETKAGLKFFIYDGEGELDFSDAQTMLDFSNIDEATLCVIDFMLYHGYAPREASAKSKRIAQDFIALLDKNIQKQANYLTPQGHEQIQNLLMNAQENPFSKENYANLQ